MRDLKARAGPGPGRFPTFYLITGHIPLSPRRNSADSTAGSQMSTLVCHTSGLDPP